VAIVAQKMTGGQSLLAASASRVLHMSDSAGEWNSPRAPFRRTL